jgi:hypothetical protein
MDEIAKGSEEMMKRVQAWKVQDTYRISKNAAMKRYINKRESPPCPIEEEKVCECFRETCDPPKQALFEAEQDSPFHLDKKLPNEDVPEDMIEDMLSEDNIWAVIR